MTSDWVHTALSRDAFARIHACTRRVPDRTRRRTTRCPSARHCADLTLDEHTERNARIIDRRIVARLVTMSDRGKYSSVTSSLVSISGNARGSYDLRVINELNASIYKSGEYILQ